mmetsp:Transcript_811/g.2945  ORF Transcript_811/g.2945 Transcript_811/m.2945 type:complete len:212 (-) Transcript_811:63-698(-)
MRYSPRSSDSNPQEERARARLAWEKELRRFLSESSRRREMPPAMWRAVSSTRSIFAMRLPVHVTTGTVVPLSPSPEAEHSMSMISCRTFASGVKPTHDKTTTCTRASRSFPRSFTTSGFVSPPISKTLCASQKNTSVPSGGEAPIAASISFSTSGVLAHNAEAVVACSSPGPQQYFGSISGSSALADLLRSRLPPSLRSRWPSCLCSRWWR